MRLMQENALLRGLDSADPSVVRLRPSGFAARRRSVDAPPKTHSRTWGDAPAAYHNAACGYSFADGHSEIHKWRGRWMADRSIKNIPGDYGGVSAADPASQQDFRWEYERTSISRQSN